MALTGQQLYDYIVRTFKRTDKTSEVYEAITDTILDMKLRFKPEDFKEEVYTTGITALGQYKLDLPDNFSHLIGDIRLLDGNDGYVLIQRSKETFDRLYPHPNATNVDKARPRDYCIFAGQILLGSVPDKITYGYEFSYTTEDNLQVVSTTAVVPFSSYNRETLKYGTLYRLYTQLGFEDEAVKWRGLYEESLGKLILKEKRNTQGQMAVSFNDL